jgi:hypothetical protein
MQAVTLYRGCIWTVEERMRFDALAQEWRIEEQLVKYDPSFREIESQRLLAADLTERPIIPLGGKMDLAVEEDTGLVYAYSSSLQEGDALLRDSLLLESRQRSSALFPNGGNEALAFPLRFGRRFWFASSFDAVDVSQNYLFCFDRATHRSWQLKSGFNDDFYHTGPITEWQAMDMYSRTYCFFGSDEEGEQGALPGAPILFIVELKA